MMIEKVISGGQTGVDLAGWRAARACNLATGGWMPKGFLTEDGPRPEFAELYGAVATRSPHYPPRTRMNVFGSDATVILNRNQRHSGGTKLALRIAEEYRRPALVVVVISEDWRPTHDPASLAGWIQMHAVKTLNVAGNRESSAPGIGAWAESYLSEVFRILEGGER